MKEGLDEFRRQARLVRQGLLDRDAVLAGLRKFRPDRGDGLAVVQLSGGDQAGDHEGGHRLGGGKHRRQGVDSEGPGARAVGEAADQVDDNFPFYGQAEPRAQLLAAGEIGGEGLANLVVLWRAKAADVIFAQGPILSGRISGRNHGPFVSLE